MAAYLVRMLLFVTVVLYAALLMAISPGLASSDIKSRLHVSPAEPKGDVFVFEVLRWSFEKGAQTVSKGHIGFDEAVRILREQIDGPSRRYESSHSHFLDLVEVYRSRGKDEEAAAVLKEGIDRYPKVVALHTRLAMLYRDAGRLDDSIQLLRQAIEVETKEQTGGPVIAPEILGRLEYELGLTYSKKKDYDQAIAAFRRAQQKYPNYPSAAKSGWSKWASGIDYALGLAFFENARFDEAITYLRRAIELGKDAHADLQRVREAKQKAEGRIAELTQLGSNAEQRGQLRESLKHYASVLPYVAEASTEERDLQQRILKIARSIQPPPTIPDEAHRQLVFGVTATRQAKAPADFENAVREFRKAIRLAPWWADAYLNLAIAQEGAGKFGDAAKSLELFLLAAPNDPEAKRLQNKIYELEYKARTTQKR